VGRQAEGFDFADRPRDALVLWVPTLVGLAILAVLLGVVVWTPAAGTGVHGGTDQAAGTGPALSPSRVPSPSSVPSAHRTSPRPAVSQSPRSAARSAVSKAPRTVPPADVTGRYRVVASYQTEFIGEVRISNGSSGPRHWTVRLAFGRDVGAMRTFWVESQPQATLRRSGPAYIFSSTAPVAARSTAVLRFQFNRSGRDNKPESCSTNGLTCAGLG
jgi:hypothetical protein